MRENRKRLERAERMFLKMLPKIDKIGRRCFHGRHDADDRLQDLRGLIWQALLRCIESGNDRFTESTLIYYACRQVRSGRGLCRASTASIDGRRAHDVGRRAVTMAEFIDPREDPADIAAFRIDVPEWIAALPASLRRTLLAILQAGPDGRGKDIAEDLGVSQARVSQRRRELVAHWERFTS